MVYNLAFIAKENILTGIDAQTYSAPVKGLLDKKERVRLFLFAGLLVLSLVVYFQFEPDRQPTGGDLSMWDYMAQSIVRGAVPYRDVVNIKTPLGSYLGAAAIVTGKLFGLRDIIAIRYLHILFASLTVAMTFLIVDLYWRRRMVAVIAALVMLSYDSFGIWNASGSQVKTTTILFGLFSLYAIARGQAWLAGFWGALSFWCWQPGLLFTGTAGLVFCRFLTKPFDRRAFAAAFGAAVPLLLGVLFFMSFGAWKDFYRWCFEFNTTNNSSVESAFAWARAFIIVKKSYPGEWLWFALFPLGLLLRIVEIIRIFRHLGARDFLAGSWRLAPEVAFGVYGLFTFSNLQSGPDCIMFLPFISAYAALTIGGLVDLSTNLLKRWNWTWRGLPLLRLAPVAAIIALIFLFQVADAFRYDPGFTLQDEEREWREVVSQLSPTEAVYAQGSLDLLVLYNRPNANKYIYFDRGKDTYAGLLEQGGFNAIVEDLKRRSPKFVSLAKLVRIKERAKLLQWVNEFYEPYKEIPSTNSGVNATTYPCSVYRLRSGAAAVPAVARDNRSEKQVITEDE
jgi:hypothetical protein